MTTKRENIFNWYIVCSGKNKVTNGLQVARLFGLNSALYTRHTFCFHFSYMKTTHTTYPHTHSGTLKWILTFCRFLTSSWVGTFICVAFANWPAATNKQKTVTTYLPMPTSIPVPEKMIFIMTSIIAFTTKALK